MSDARQGDRDLRETRRRDWWRGLMAKASMGVATMALGGFYCSASYFVFLNFFKVDGIMLWSFLFGVPLVIGLLLGYVAFRRKAAGIAGAAALASTATFVSVFGVGAFFREGMICIVMALPLFLILAALGATVGSFVARDGGPRGPKALSLALIAPAVLGMIEQNIASPDLLISTTREIAIAASPATVWRHINYPTDIKREELSGGIAYWIGVPYPLEARTLEERVGGKRALTWDRGITFDEVITEWRPERRIAWTYAFSAQSFPPGSLDDHIVIGGRYFDLVSTSYDLQPEGSGTRLTIRVQTRVTTNFNWYAGWWARLLVGDTASVILTFYKTRSERGA
jgi:Activator of Hsp90 ATPase homolog 1-like protein